MSPSEALTVHLATREKTGFDTNKRAIPNEPQGHLGK